MWIWNQTLQNPKTLLQFKFPQKILLKSMINFSLEMHNFYKIHVTPVGDSLLQYKLSTSSLHWTILISFCVPFEQWSMFPSVHLYLSPKMQFYAKSASKITVPPKELQLFVSIGTFLTNYDVINRKLYCIETYFTVQKQTK